MSTLLYSLGSFATKARVFIIAAWVVLLGILATTAVFFGKGADAPIEIPGTESQTALDTLERVFPEVSGSSAQIIVVAPKGSRVDQQPFRDALTSVAHTLDDTKGVRGVQYPFSKQAPAGLSKDRTAALMTVQVAGTVDKAPPTAKAAVKKAVTDLRGELPKGSTVSYGGQIFSVSVPHLSATEGIGVVVAFFVLLITLGSLIAAGMPLLIALVGVGVAMAGIWLVTAFVPLTSVTPMLALMLGLAVGIDYTLFIVSRHQEQLARGMDVKESIARATATSGSAVVFAGLTVVIALIGLSVAQIPFLTALGVSASAAVAVAVLIALTLTPAVLAVVGERILPKRQRRALRREAAHAESAGVAESAGAAETAPESAPEMAGAAETAPETAGAAGSTPETAARPARKVPFDERVFARWVAIATKKPLLTVLAIVVTLGIASIPAAQLRLALPDASILGKDDPARVTYELTAKHFGPGANGPLLMSGSIITSTDPLGLMKDLKHEIERIPGVAEVPLATPNRGADTGILVVTPKTGPHDAATETLVNELRSHHDEWKKKYGVSLSVTGFTAVGIDVSNLLFKALIPFTVLVVGLSLLLLAMVFRSVWVPIKATLGYLLSVGVAFGAVVVVFQWGWLNSALNIPATSPVLSFMPIILMGVLFGLAMDYEVFLVSRIREEFAHGATTHDAIHTGFVQSGKVVSAAAIIMFAVFAAFVPGGDMSIKTIAWGLAVGVFVDAFIVRMTLVPAVLEMLGRHAWWMPRWLDRLLPHFDVEGEGLTREMQHLEWPPDRPDAVIATDRVWIPSVHTHTALEVPNLRVAPGETLVIPVESALATPLAQLLTGRRDAASGTVKVLGYLLPERAGTVRARATVCTLAGVRDALRDRPELVVIDLRGDAGAPAGLHSDAHSALSARAAEDSRAAERSTPPPRPLTVVIIGSEYHARQLLPRGSRITALPTDPRSAASNVPGSAANVPGSAANDPGTAAPNDPHTDPADTVLEGASR